MKKIITKILLVFMGLFLMQSCEEGDKTVDFVYDGVTRGATLKTMNVISGVIDIFNLNTSVYEVELEYRDHVQGALFQSFDVYARFLDNTDDGVDNGTGEAFLFNVPASSFAIDPEFGFPRGILSIPASDAVTALGLTEDQLNGGDAIIYRLDLKLTDGRSFTDNASGNVAGGSFFSSPFAYAVPMVCLFDVPDFFSGSYLMEQTVGSDPFFGVKTWGTGQIVDVTAAGINRSFVFAYFPGIFDVETLCSLDLICGEIFVLAKPTGGGVGCGGTIASSTGNVPSTFDVELIEDGVIEINISDFDPDGECGTGPNQIVIRMTKQ